MMDRGVGLIVRRVWSQLLIQCEGWERLIIWRPVVDEGQGSVEHADYCTISQVTCPASLSAVFAADLVKKKKKPNMIGGVA